MLGLEPRTYRALIVRLGVRHVIDGRRVIALVTDVVAALERAAVTDATPGDANAEEHDEQPRSVDDVVRLIGRRATRQSA